MLIVFILIAILLIVLAIVGYNCLDWDGLAAVFTAVGVVILFVSTIVGLVLIADIQSIKLIDDKIAVTEEYNAEIEESIKSTIVQYQEYEGKTYAEFKVDDIVAAVNVYPELKSNEMVRELINTYVENKKLLKNFNLKDYTKKFINGGFISVNNMDKSIISKSMEDASRDGEFMKRTLDCQNDFDKIVHCKDCKHSYVIAGIRYCECWGIFIDDCMCQDNEFCSRGELRDD